MRTLKPKYLSKEAKRQRVLSVMLIILLGFGVSYTYAQQHKDYSYTYEGKTYYFCCPSCIEEFKKDPERDISKIKEISLEAYQFGFSPGPIIVKKGDIVKLSMTSHDVPHGVYIKEYGINATVKKGEVKYKDFIADKAGEFDIVCSVYCGRGHNRMRGKLIVEE